MKLSLGRTLIGPAGVATEIIFTGRPPRPDQAATVATWFLDCPGQSPAWSAYLLSVIHLRPIDGVRPAVVKVPHATHEILVVALNPDGHPHPLRHRSWRLLTPVNVSEQVQLPDDDAAVDLARQAAWAVVNDVLPAEPPLAGAVEPWRTSMIKSAAHIRGEEHAP